MLCFLHIEGKALHLQKYYNSLYCDARLIVVVWNQTYRIYQVYLSAKTTSATTKNHRSLWRGHLKYPEFAVLYHVIERGCI